MPVINGTSANDTLNGTSGDDTINGLAGDDKLYGLEGNDTLVGGPGTDTMTGGPGDDHYFVDNASDVVIEQAGEGIDTVTSALSYTLGPNVENLVLTGSASLFGIGNGLNNVITGNAAPNFLNGGVGTDTMIGGAGDDTYFVDNVGDVVVEAASEGRDWVNSSVTFTLSSDVENLTLTGFSAINGFGNSSDNTLVGNDQANALDGGAGIDSMQGGKGDDTYYVDNVFDHVVENRREGTDLVLSSVSFTLGDNVENLILTGSADADGTGNGLDNIITGNSGANVLSGLDGNDTIEGKAGNDTLTGGGAADTFKFTAGDGQDTITDLGGGDRVEIRGYASAQSITQVGSDVILVLSDSDQITFLSTTVASVQSSIGFPGTVHSFVGTSGNDTINGTPGNDDIRAGLGNDTINAGSGNDRIEGGAGNDIVYDGPGNDYVNDADDAIYIYGSPGDDYYDGGEQSIWPNTDFDTVDYSSAAAAIFVDLRLANGIAHSLAAGDAANIGVDTIVNVEKIIGTPFDDVIYGSDTGRSQGDPYYDEYLVGGAGNDTIYGGDGADYIDGGPGADVMYGGPGSDTFIVDDVDDQIVAPSNTVGSDHLYSSVSYDLSGDPNRVGVRELTLTGSSAINATANDAGMHINGNNASNIITGGAGNDLIYGNGGDDYLDGGVAADSMVGGAGNDTYIVDNVGDQVIESLNGGIDIAFSSVTFDISIYSSDSMENLTLTGTDAINGTGNTLNNILTGNSAANKLWGGLGNDLLIGGSGTDFLDGQGGSDIYIIATATEHSGSEFHDTGPGGDIDEVRFASTVAGETLLLRSDDSGIERIVIGTGTAASADTSATTALDVNAGALPNGVTIVGNDGANTIVGSAFADTVSGGGGADFLHGLAGDDTIFGGAGGDTIQGGDGSDSMSGGGGDDYYYVDNVGDLVTENAGEGTDVVNSSISWTLGANIERLVLTGTANINGTGNGDANILTGNSGDNQLSGMVGNDTLNGASGNDTLLGGAGADLLSGSVGNDTIEGGADRDDMTGGIGADTFVFRDGDFSGTTFTTADIVRDFSTAEGDHMDLHFVDADTANGGGTNEAFSFIGTAAFSHTAGELRYEQVSGFTYVYGDTNGDGIADFMVRLDGLHSLTGGDFVL